MSRPADGAYVRRMNRPPALFLAVALTILAALAGCSLGGAERVGGEPPADAHELTMLNPFGPTEVTSFVNEVARLSKGRLRIRLVPAEHPGPDYEAATIRDMQGGRADLASVGTRAWDEFGAPSLSALGAPFLVDSYPLQERILTSGLAETMLQELRPAGLVGIGILPGPLRRPLGLAGALASPGDFQGLAIGTQQSNVADATLRALGASPRRLPFDFSAPRGLVGLDGVELQVTGVETGRLDAEGSHLMTNVNLWPRSLVVVAGEEVYSQMSDDERKILRAASMNVVPAMADTDRSLDEEAAANLCRKGHAAFDAASPQQLRALRRAVEPVYVDLERDPGARKVIEGIEQLKAELAEPPTEIAPCTPAPDAPSAGDVTDLDGVWTMDTDRSAAVPEHFAENWGHWVFVFDRGSFAITQENETSCTWGYGTYAVNGNRMSWSFHDGGGIAPNNATNRPGEYFVFDFSAYRDTLTLEPVENEVSPLNFRAEPWRRVSETASSTHLSTRCPPPPGALDP
jgi:TRAP-type C4-dicarboxylate transport system substrate-binding protein